MNRSFSPRNGEVILKAKEVRAHRRVFGFSPRNGEVILKVEENSFRDFEGGFSPRNGEVILKATGQARYIPMPWFQSPQWGSNSKDGRYFTSPIGTGFQSPQWGSNSKG